MPGNKPNYSRIDVLRTFLLIRGNKSRLELVKKLDLGEGTIRSILDLIKNKMLIVSTNKGHFLTKKGFNLIKNINSLIEIKDIEFSEIYPETAKSLVLVKTKEKKAISVEFRDTAVREGADGAIIAQFNKNIVIPCPDIDFKKTYPNDYRKIMLSLKPEKGNILIICFANEKSNAEKGALVISLKISKELNNILNMIC